MSSSIHAALADLDHAPRLIAPEYADSFKRGVSGGHWATRETLKLRTATCLDRGFPDLVRIQADLLPDLAQIEPREAHRQLGGLYALHRYLRFWRFCMARNQAIARSN